MFLIRCRQPKHSRIESVFVIGFFCSISKLVKLIVVSKSPAFVLTFPWTVITLKLLRDDSIVSKQWLANSRTSPRVLELVYFNITIIFIINVFWLPVFIQKSLHFPSNRIPLIFFLLSYRFIFWLNIIIYLSYLITILIGILGHYFILIWILCLRIIILIIK